MRTLHQTNEPFWKSKSMQEMSIDEWESLCDGCGLCCLHKIQDVDTNVVYYTSVACSQLNLETCRCRKYTERLKTVADCVDITHQNISDCDWLPETCAYQLVSRGEDLPNWHPLLTGNLESTHHSGVSIQGFAIQEGPNTKPEHHILDWPVPINKTKRNPA